MLLSAIFSSFLATVLAHGVYENQNVHFMEIGDKAGVNQLLQKTLVYSNCNSSSGPADYPIMLKNLGIIPDPIILNSQQPPLVNASVEVQKTLAGNNIDYNLDLLMWVGDQKSGKFMSMCDLLPPAVCKGEDVCKLMQDTISPSKCPSILVKQGFDCKCPIKKNLYSVVNLILEGLPTVKFEISGKFKVVVKLNQGKSDLMCFDIQFCIKSCGEDRK